MADGVNKDEVLIAFAAETRKQAEEKGHTMGPWRFDVNTGGSDLQAKCTTCEASVRIFMQGDIAALWPTGINRAIEWRCPNYSSPSVTTYD